MTDFLVYLGIFLAVLGEGTIVVGTFIPGVNTVIISSFLASTGKLNVALVFISAWVGMWLGDHIGYLLGRYGLHRVPTANRWFHKVRPQVERFAEKHDRLLVFYQFIGVARSPFPILLGIVEHPLRKWLGLLSAATTLFVGFLVGSSYILGRLLGKDKALKVALVVEIIVGVLFFAVAFREVFARYKRKSKA